MTLCIAGFSLELIHSSNSTSTVATQAPDQPKQQPGPSRIDVTSAAGSAVVQTRLLDSAPGVFFCEECIDCSAVRAVFEGMYAELRDSGIYFAYVNCHAPRNASAMSLIDEFASVVVPPRDPAILVSGFGRNPVALAQPKGDKAADIVALVRYHY